MEIYEKNGIFFIVGKGTPPKNSPKTSFIEKVKYYANKYGIPEKVFINLVKVESNFNPRAVSPRGAMGLCQLMPETAKMLGVKDPFDIDENLDAGARYLKSLYLRYGDWKLALAAYNAGSGAVKKYGGIPPYRETRRFLKAVVSESKRKRKKYRIRIRRVGDTVIIEQAFEEEEQK